MPIHAADGAEAAAAATEVAELGATTVARQLPAQMADGCTAALAELTGRASEDAADLLCERSRKEGVTRQGALLNFTDPPPEGTIPFPAAVGATGAGARGSCCPASGLGERK